MFFFHAIRVRVYRCILVGNSKSFWKPALIKMFAVNGLNLHLKI